MSEYKCILLGTGTSQGIPVIGCKCAVCLSTNPKDTRLRTSAMLVLGDVQIVIDTGPDFRQQMLNTQIDRLDAVLITHQHNDHIIGLDDVRPFNFKQKMAMPLFASKEVINEIRLKFNYAFAENKYPGAPSFETYEIDKKAFSIKGHSIQPIHYMHGNLSVIGFRISNLAYVTDIKSISNKEIEKLFGLSVLVLSALHHNEHHSHFNLQQALDFIEQVKPEQAYLTHLSHRMGRHNSIIDLLPNNVSIGYDGQEILFM